MKKLLSSLLSILMLVTVIGSISFADNATLTSYNVIDIKDNIKKLGRASDTKEGIALDWTASGIEFNANCAGDVALKIQASCSSPDSNAHDNDKDCYYTVYIDGVRQNNRLRVMNGTFTVKIAEGLDIGDHTFKVVKMTEAVNAKTVVQAIELNGTFGEKPAASKYIIEAIGDSITSGHSSTAIGISDTARSRFSDGTRTYAYLTAENLGAEARVISQSGQTMSGMYSNYQKERFNDTEGTFKFSSVQKPNVVLIGLGTNDGNRTVDYWYEWLNKYIKLIRDGYKDNSISFVFVHDMISNGNLRANVSQAFAKIRKEQAALQAENPNETYGGFYMVNGHNDGGHPRQAGHSYTARRVTQLLVNKGIIPIEALKSDATATLTATNKTESMFKDFDSTVTAPSGVTYSKVSPLDPDDADSETVAAAKFVADGTQSESTVSLGSISDYANYATKGISFYINYKNTGDTFEKPYLYIKGGDQTYKQVLDVKEGVTTKVTLDWENMSSAGVYVYQRMLFQGSKPEFSLYFGTGTYEYTIDNLKVLYNDYTVKENANSAYKEITAPLIVTGVTDNFDIPTEVTTTTTTNPATANNTYITLYDVDSDTNDVTFTASGTKSAPVITSDAGLPYNTSTNSAKMLKYQGGGNYSNPTITFEGDTISDQIQDSIGVRVWIAADKESPAGNRSGVLFSFYDSVNDKYYYAAQWGGSKVGITTEGAWYSVFWSDFSKSGNLLAIGAGNGTVKASDVYKNFTKLRVSSGVNGNGSWSTLVDNNIYLDDLQLIYPEDYTPSETATKSTVSTTTTTKVTTPEVPGEKVLYTMDSGSRPSSALVTSREGYVNYVEVDGDYVMQITRTGSKGTWQDQAACFTLPISDMKAIGTPESVTFDIWTDQGNVAIGQIFLSDSFTNASGGSSSTASMASITPGTTKQKVTLDLTTDEAKKAIKNGYKYVCLRNQWSGNNTCTYAYIDNVVYNYSDLIIYKVTVDGVEQTFENDTFTLPTSTATGFIGYFDGEKLYDAGTSIEVEKNYSFITIAVGEVKMSEGASMRLKTQSGIRFYTNIDTEKIDAIRNLGITVELGTLIGPRYKSNDTFGDLTFDTDSIYKADVEYKSKDYYTEGNFKGIVGSIVNIKDYNINRRFAGRGYVIVSLGDYRRTIYADYYNSDMKNNIRTVAFLSNAVVADTEYYATLSDSQKAVVDKFAAAYDENEEY